VLGALAGDHGPDPHRAEEDEEPSQDRGQDPEEPPLAGLQLLEAFAQGHRPSLSGFDEPAAAGLPDADADADAEPSGSVGFFFLSSHLSSSSSTYFCFPSLN